MNPWFLAPAGLAASAAGGAYWALRRKGLHRWLAPYVFSAGRRRLPRPDEPVHVLLAICDHYEPKLGGAPPAVARERVRRWVEEYPRQLGGFRDSDGRPPRHTFFYPAEEYEPEYLDALAGLCRAGYGEVEIHLHHDNDTADNLRRTLQDFKALLHQRHGLLGRDRRTDQVAYGFIHGNWALDNSRCDGRWCGVNNELDVLRETGCYADFTLPSAPSETQTNKINSVYWAVDDPARPKSHNWGPDVGSVPRPANSLLMIQGPLLFDWSRRKLGVVPRVENACLQESQPPSLHRLDNWLRARVHVRSRPDWLFVKLHTHGANEANMPALLGDAMIRFHVGLAERGGREKNFNFHYVSAREMANLALAADAGWNGSVVEARDFAVTLNHHDTYGGPTESSLPAATASRPG
ncbi:MAG: hypothetical protein ACJ8F7_19270 [Gemmataceae bacterium]